MCFYNPSVVGSVHDYIVEKVSLCVLCAGWPGKTRQNNQDNDKLDYLLPESSPVSSMV